MGQNTDAAIEAWQDRAGIDPAIGPLDEMLGALSRSAYELIRIIELERSGIRDGDGFWHGSDALAGTVEGIGVQWECYCLATARKQDGPIKDGGVPRRANGDC